METEELTLESAGNQLQSLQKEVSEKIDSATWNAWEVNKYVIDTNTQYMQILGVLSHICEEVASLKNGKVEKID